MKTWKSVAVWPDELHVPNDISEDEHDTEDQAKGVCQLLEKEGFGGERKVFPIKTYVEHIE